ncbi:MAG: LysM peptidoglycan-binding domain-containing protein, partial [Anaerolineae bacterium]|nr:LysM peptidoglycan-binding domain-containing protein [Anaerolineae bacterium]
LVQYGDTLDGIIFAYSSQGISITVDDLMRFNSWRFKPQFIFVGDEIIILPPGSVDPNTGQLIALPSNIPGAAQPTAAPATADTTGQIAPTPTVAAVSPENLPSEPSVPAVQSIDPFVPVDSLN